MNPIPLSAPDGRIYAYACGVCHQTRHGSQLPGRGATGPIRGLVASSLRDAERCCTCLGCRTPLDASVSELLLCAACNWQFKMCDLWSGIECCMRHGFMTQEQLDAYMDGDDE